MARLSPEDQQRDEEELEYQRNQPIDIPAQRKKSAMDRLRGMAHSVTNNPDVVNTMQAVRKHAERINSQDSFTRSPPPPQYSNRIQQPSQPVNQGSILHPGNRLYVIEGSLIATGGGVKKSQEEREQRKRRGFSSQPGFGNDPGL